MAFHKTSNSTLAIGATSYLSSSSTYDSRPFKITISSPGSAYMPSNTAAVVWRGSWSDPFPTNGNKATVYLNPTWTWTTSFNVTQKKADTKTIVLHELGHAHGLAHPSSTYYCSDGGVMSPSEQSSVMNVTFTVKRSLTADDRAGLAQLY